MLYIAFTLLILWLWHYTLLRQDMAVNQNERLSHITLKNKLKQTNKVSILHVCYQYCAVFYMPVTNIVPYFTCLLLIVCRILHACCQYCTRHAIDIYT